MQTKLYNQIITAILKGDRCNNAEVAGRKKRTI